MSISEELKALWNMQLRQLIESLDLYRLSERGKGKPLHPFVRGLILSSTIINQIRLEVNPKYSVSWGQIMDNQGQLSKEVDVIIYEGRPYQEWRDIGFVIVPKEEVLAIIEVKTYSYVSQMKKEYRGLCNYAEKIYAFTESYAASKRAYEKYRKTLMKIGFEDVFSLYLWLGDEIKELLYEEWYRFLDTMRNARFAEPHVRFR